jgi:DNA repair protein RAD50
MAGFDKYVSLQIKRLGSEGQEELQTQVDDWKAVVARAKAMLPKEELARTIKGTDIPQLEKKIDEQSEDLSGKSKVAEEASHALKSLKEEVEEISSLKRVAADAARMLNEVSVLKSEVSTLEGDLASTGSIQTGDQVQTAINEMADNIKRLKRECQTIERNREAKRTDLNNAERASFRSEKLVSEKEQEVSRRRSLQKRIDELKEEYTEGTEMLKALDEAIDGYSAPIKKVKDELEQLKSDNAQEESKRASRVETYQAKLRILQDCQLQIQRYVDQRGAQKLADCVDTIRDLQGQIQEINDRIKEVESDISKIDKDLNESKATERNIVDNLQYRQLGRDIRKIEEDLSQLDLDEASKNRREFESKYHAQNQEVNKLNGESQHLSGEIASLQEQLNARDDELKKDYKDVAKRFSQKLVEVKTSEIANSDLEKYAKALDAAIIRFHGLKMQEINEQIRYLWAKTYQGTDIDSISIESDGEKVGNRSYNYRVCMMKDTVKMDMRGRCSAGQKVLASIIIRLALADSFATNCRFMALDEPTLCLDQETVEALARSLGDIIKERPSTQLLVVTHDPQFLNLLAQSTSIDHYWRVSRDASMKSIIERERIR